MASRVLALASVAALGVLIEWLQHLVFANPLETWDIRDDTYAALVGFLCALLFLKIKGLVRS